MKTRKQKGDAAQLLLAHHNFSASQIGAWEACEVLRPIRAGQWRRAAAALGIC